VALIPVLTLSIVGNQQFTNAYPLWSQKHMDLVLFGWQVPVTWLQAVDAFVSTGTMIASIAFWRCFVGWLAGFLETMPGREFWGLHAALVASAGVLLLACRFVFGRLLAPDDATPRAGVACRRSLDRSLTRPHRSTCAT